MCGSVCMDQYTICMVSTIITVSPHPQLQWMLTGSLHYRLGFVPSSRPPHPQWLQAGSFHYMGSLAPSLCP